MAATIQLQVNGNKLPTDADPPHRLRDDLDLTGTKYARGEGQCRACTVDLQLK